MHRQTYFHSLTFQSPSDVPFIENEKIDSHTINSSVVFKKLAEWEENEKAKGNKSTLPNYDFMAVFTGLKMIIDI